MKRAALLPLLVLLAACAPEPTASCPGERVGSFAFSGTKREAGMLAAGLDPDPALTDCAAAVGFPDPSLLPFTGTLSADATGPAVALCRSDGPVLFGTRIGTRWKIVNEADGAVLGGCGPTCAAHSGVVITGDVVPDASAPAEFSGALVEELTVMDGACGACVLPCAARYALTGTVEVP